MTTPPNSTFIRLVHLENNDGRLYLNDLDSEHENKKQYYKIPVYVDVGETVDIPFNDAVLVSYKRGSIRKFVDNDLLEAYVFNSQCVEEVEGVSSYAIRPDAHLVLVDTSSGDVTTTLPDSSEIPTGREITIKETSDSGNRVIVETQSGDLIEGLTSARTLVGQFSAITLRSDSSGNWWVIQSDSTGSGSGGGDRVEHFDITADSTSSVTLSESPIVDSEQVRWNGVTLTRGSNYDYELSGSTVTFVNGVDLKPGDLIKVRYVPQ